MSQSRPTAETGPIGVGLPQLAGTTPDGRDVTTAGPSAWRPAFHEVAAAGFTEIDLFASHIRISELDDVGRQSLLRTLGEYGPRIRDRPRGRPRPLAARADRAAAALRSAY